MKIWSVAAAAIDSPPPFKTLRYDGKPYADLFRIYSETYRKFIVEETRKRLDEGILEESRLPWRTQVLVTGGSIRKKEWLLNNYAQ